MSQLNQRLNNQSAENIYYDLTVSNFQSSEANPQPFYFNESRSQPYIMNPSDYFLSIIRFTLDTGTIPVFIPSIQPNQADPNLTIYSVSMSWLDPTTNIYYEEQEFIQYQPQDLSIAVPAPPSQTANGLQLNETGYYNVYSYQWLCYLVFVAFEGVAAKLALATALSPNPPILTYSPIINWDSSSQKAVIYANAAVYDLNEQFYAPTAAAVNVYMNAPLFGLFSSFPARYLGYGQSLGTDYRLLFVDIGGTNLQTIVPPQPAVPGNVEYVAINIYQETSTCSSITPILAIVFTSNSLGIESNIVSTPLVYNNNQLLTFAGQNAATSNIITDLVSDSGTYSPNLVYQPSAQYRLITLYGNSPLSNLDISIFYRLRNGSLIPFRLQSGGSVTMKILFTKKSMNIK